MTRSTQAGPYPKQAKEQLAMPVATIRSMTLTGPSVPTRKKVHADHGIGQSYIWRAHRYPPAVLPEVLQPERGT